MPQYKQMLHTPTPTRARHRIHNTSSLKPIDLDDAARLHPEAFSAAMAGSAALLDVMRSFFRGLIYGNPPSAASQRQQQLALDKADKALDRLSPREQAIAVALVQRQMKRLDPDVLFPTAGPHSPKQNAAPGHG
jgi:DNA-binding NarL/FixJ family response regulator